MVLRQMVKSTIYQQVILIDGDITNNHYSNLRWLPRGVNSSIRHNKGRGVQNHESKLTDSDVVEICNLLRCSVSLNAIARQYNVSKSTISLIRRKKTWKHISLSYSW